MVNQIGRVDQTVPGLKQPGVSGGPVVTEDFSRLLNSSLKFSKHVSDRIERRQIDMSADRIGLLESAVDKAAAKGARESLVLLNDLAVLVSIRNRTVITAMERENMKEGVFTQIDSAVIV